MTMTAWINPSTLTQWYRIFDCENSTSTSGFCLGIGQNGASISARIGGTVEPLSMGVIVTNKWQHIAVTYDGSNIKTYINSVLVNTTAKTGSISYTGATDLCIGGSVVVTPYSFTGKIGSCRLYDNALTQADINTIYYGGFDNFVIFDGNSLVAGYPANSTSTGPNTTFPNGTDFPSVVMSHFDDTWLGFNVAISARELDSTTSDNHLTPPGSSQNTDFTNNILPLITNLLASGASKVVVVNGGEPRAMMYYATLNSGHGGSIVQDAAYAALQAYRSLVNSAGAKLVIIGMPNCNATGSSNSSLLSDINAVNQRVRSNWRTDGLCDGFVDLDLDTRMQNCTNTTYYTDGVHFTTEGYKVWAQWVIPVIAEV